MGRIPPVYRLSLAIPVVVVLVASGSWTAQEVDDRLEAIRPACAFATVWREDVEKPGFGFPSVRMVTAVEFLSASPSGRSGTTTTKAASSSETGFTALAPGKPQRHANQARDHRSCRPRRPAHQFRELIRGENGGGCRGSCSHSTCCGPYPSRAATRAPSRSASRRDRSERSRTGRAPRASTRTRARGWQRWLAVLLLHRRCSGPV